LLVIGFCTFSEDESRPECEAPALEELLVIISFKVPTSSSDKAEALGRHMASPRAQRPPVAKPQPDPVLVRLRPLGLSFLINIHPTPYQAGVMRCNMHMGPCPQVASILERQIVKD
jgi:hypothetical protein